MPQKKLITSALPYVNNAPHLGNIVGCVLSADVYARFCRAQGYETLYICGTDGYGTATENKAKAEGVSPREICERFHKIHAQVYKDFNIQFDAFGKTFCETHTEVVQSMYDQVKESGYLFEQETDQSYCNSCETFLADRFVEGICPHCQYEHARGDQCESCGNLLNPTDLLKPQCATCKNEPSVKTTKHLFLDLTKIASDLKSWQDQSITEGNWTTNAKTTTQSWMDQGLNPRPITRDLKWGVPVPAQGYEDKVFYVWFDAPIGYISITKDHFPSTWKDWWLDPDNTELYQFMGKDNIPFHSVIFPATQMASQQSWTRVHHLNSTEYLNYENTKFSKSKNIGIFGTEVAQLSFPIDFWRFYLMRTRPEKQDANFLWQDFYEKINAELIDNIANLVNRVLVFYLKNFPHPLKQGQWNQEEQSYIESTSQLQRSIIQNLEKVNLREGIKGIIQLGKLGNRFFQDREPWKTVKTEPESAERTLNLLVYTVRDLAVLLQPYLPDTSSQILSWLPDANQSFGALVNFTNLTGTLPKKPSILFKKITSEEIAKYQAQFSGVTSPGFNDLDIRVGEIVAAKSHPDAKNLLVEDIDLGNCSIQVVSGIAKFYSPEELVGKRVPVLVNLPPATIRGEKSEGMVLVAEKGKKMELIIVEADKGSRILIDPNAPTPSKTVSFEEFQNIKIDIVDHKVSWQQQPLTASGQQLATEKLSHGKIS